jgi:hypothetical protein
MGRIREISRLGELIALFAAAQSSAAIDLYFNDIEAETPGTGVRPTDFYEFHGDGASVILTEAITASDGVGGSQSYMQTINANGAGYFYSGFGHYAVDYTNMPVGPDASNPAMYRFSAFVKVSGNLNDTPVTIRVAAIDVDYEVVHNIDVNGDGDLLDGASVFEPVVTPRLVSGYTPVSFTLDQGTQEVDSDVLPQHRVFSQELSLLWQVNFHNGGFGNDNGNQLSIDNVRIEFLGQPGQRGDYNGDGDVDAGDYVKWRNSLGGTMLLNEGVTLGSVDVADYAEWKTHYGEPDGGGGSVGGQAAPEPATLFYVLVAVIGALPLSPARSSRYVRFREFSNLTPIQP